MSPKLMTRDELIAHVAKVLRGTTRGVDPWISYARAAVDAVYDVASPIWSLSAPLAEGEVTTNG